MYTQEVLTGSAGSVSVVLRISLQIKVMCSNITEFLVSWQPKTNKNNHGIHQKSEEKGKRYDVVI